MAGFIERAREKQRRRVRDRGGDPSIIKGGPSKESKKAARDFNRRSGGGGGSRSRADIGRDIGSDAFRKKLEGAIKDRPDDFAAAPQTPIRRSGGSGGSSRRRRSSISQAQTPKPEPAISPPSPESRPTVISAAPNNRFIPDSIEFPAKRFFGGIKQGVLNPGQAARELRAEQTSGALEAGQAIGFVGGALTFGRLGGPGAAAKASAATSKAASAAKAAAPASRAAKANPTILDDLARGARAGKEAVSVGGLKAVQATKAGAAKVKKAADAARKATNAKELQKAAKLADEAGDAAKAADLTRRAKLAEFVERSQVKGIAKIGAQGAAGGLATRGVARGTRDKQERGGLTNKQFEAATSAALQEASKPTEQGIAGLGQSLAAGLNPRFSDTARFRKAARKEFQARGLKGKQLDQAVSRAVQEKNQILAIGEGLTLLNVARASESVGRKAVAGSFERAAAKGVTTTKQRAFSDVFKRTALPIAGAGVGEGAASVAAQDIVRGQGFNPADIGLGAAFGGATAGLLGGTIAGLRPNRAGASKALEIGAFITDPFEKPGDLLQDATEAAIRKTTGRTSPKPTIVQTVNPSDIMGFNLQPGSPGGKKRGGGRSKKGLGKKSPNPTLTFVGSPATAPVIAPTPVNIPSLPQPSRAPSNLPTLESIIGQPRPTPVPTPPTVPTPANTPTQTPTNVPPNVPVNVPANVPININIPTATPQLRVPPPLPLAFPAGSATGVSTKGKGRKFVNELAAGADFLKEFGLAAPAPRKRAKRSKRSKSKKSSAQDPLGIFSGGFL